MGPSSKATNDTDFTKTNNSTADVFLTIPPDRSLRVVEEE